MKTYNHAFSLAFSVAGSTHPEGEDVTAEQFEAALIKRMKELTEHNEWGEAVGGPLDSFEEDVPLLDFTVFGFSEKTGQPWCGYVKAACKDSAFSVAAHKEDGLRLVACMQGIHREHDLLLSSKSKH